MSLDTATFIESNIPTRFSMLPTKATTRIAECPNSPVVENNSLPRRKFCRISHVDLLHILGVFDARLDLFRDVL